MKKLVLTVITGLAGIMMHASAISAQTIAERVCKPPVSANGSAMLQHSAKRYSVHAWQDKVKELYGADWADYSASKVNKFPCTRAGIFVQSCEVNAQPCREALEVQG